MNCFPGLMFYLIRETRVPMKLKLSELRIERKWRSATGMDQERYYKLLEIFKVCYPFSNQEVPQ